jgi:signal transduction histidine kinase/CheY-like chemotaxis protein
VEALVEPVGESDGAWWTASSVPLEARGRRRDGAPFDAEVSVRRVEGGHRSVAVVRDTADQAWLEHEVLRLRRLETVGALTAGVAHDMNNVLMGILGCADRALRKLDGDPRVARERLEELRRVARGGASVMGRLNAYMRDGHMRRSDTTDLDATVRDTVAMLRPLLGDDIALAVVLGAPDARVPGGRSRLEQVLVNLAVNARNAMPRGGRLEIQTGRWRSDADRRVRLEIRDDGPGMSDRVRARVFEPFFSTKAGGTGLGLSTVKKIVEGTGGRIEVRSEPGEGTSFVVDLPEISSAPPPVSPPKPSAVPPAVVLLVDDDSLVRRTVRGYLEDGGHRVLEAVNAGHAVEVCRGHDGPLDLLLANVVLPGTISGPRLAEELERLRPELHVLLMSAYPHDVLVGRGHVDDATFVLQKPYSRAELENALAGVLAPSSLDR